MAYRTRIDPRGPTRQLGRRGALKQSTVIQLQKNEAVLAVESAFEVFLAKLLDLANDAAHIAYQPFTLDLANERMLLTHEDLKNHRQSLREAGMRGLFYTPDLQVSWYTPEGLVTEVMEAKDAQWVPEDTDEYAAKLHGTKALLQAHGTQFSMYETSGKDLYCLPLAMNVSKLHALKLRRYDPMHTLSQDYNEYLENLDGFLSLLAENETVSLGDLAARFSTTIWATWHLIIDERVQCDLAQGPLNPRTLVTSLLEPVSDHGSALFHNALSTLKTDAWEMAYV